MASISRVKINIINNTELRANTQSIFTFMRSKKLKNISLNYKLK